MRFRGQVETERLPNVVQVPAEAVFVTPDGPVAYRDSGGDARAVKLDARPAQRDRRSRSCRASRPATRSRAIEPDGGSDDALARVIAVLAALGVAGGLAAQAAAAAASRGDPDVSRSTKATFVRRVTAEGNLRAVKATPLDRAADPGRWAGR